MEKTGRLIQLCFGAVMIFVLFACAVRGFDSYGLRIGLLIIAAGSAALLWAACRLYRTAEKYFAKAGAAAKADRIFFVMACAMFAVQLYFGYKLSFAPITDLGYTDRAARTFCMNWSTADIYESLPARHKHYFAIYPNNQTLLIFLALIYKAEYLLTGEMSRAMPIFFNVLALNLSYVYMYRCAKLIYKDSAAKPLFVGFCGAAFSVFYTYAPFYYTDSLSMPFVMFALYRYLKASDRMHERRIKTAAVNYLLCALYTAAGFEMKGSVIVMLPAVLLFTVAERFEFKRGALVKTGVVCAFAAAVMAFITAFGAVAAMFNIADEADYERYKFPPMHWFMMGMRTRGGYSYRDFTYTLSYETYEERQAADVTRFAERAENFGVGGMTLHFFKKAAYTWADGAYLIFYHIDGGKDCALRRFITDSSVFRYLCSFYHFAMLYAVTGGFFRGYDGRSGIDRRWLLRIIFVGVFCFFMLWETRSRYLVNFTPVFIMLAADFCMSGDKDKVTFCRKAEKA